MRGTGALIVAAMLDFLTFALCAPYSETTDGKQFDLLLEKVADRGRTLYRLFQQPSHTIVKVNLSATIFSVATLRKTISKTQHLQ
jgi:DnaJ family protein C protein 13